MKTHQWLWVSCFTLLLILHCASEESNPKTENCPLPTITVVSSPVLVYTHTPDYITYYVHLLYADGFLLENAITLTNSQGIQGAAVVTQNNKRYLLLSDSRNTATGGVRIYQTSCFLEEKAHVPQGGFTQELAVYDNKVYVAVQNENKVKYFSIANIEAPGSLAAITVGNKPTNLLKIDNSLYVTNQDWADTTNPSVSVINLANNTASKTVKVGENPSALLWDGTSLFSYDSKYYSGTTASISYNIHTTANNTTAPTISLTGVTGTERPAYGGSMARAGATNYALFSEGGWGDPWRLYQFTTAGVSNRDASKDYKWIGSHPTTLYVAYNDSGTWKVTGGVFGSSEISLPATGGSFLLPAN